MANKQIHIVSFDVPYPADYGGAIDVYYRIKALHQLGYKITLHCYEYGRGMQSHLEEITEKVHYYQRPKRLLQVFSKRPFIVETRKSTELLQRLLADTHPILLEGLHSTWVLENPKIQQKITIVRTHNIEHEYYGALADKSGFLKRIYFRQEAKKLEDYESILKYASFILCICEGDVHHSKKINPNVNVLPASIPEISDSGYQETDRYALFHGNLSVVENVEAVKWIIEHIWKKDQSILPLKIAGKNPSEQFIRYVAEAGMEIIPNPSQTDLDELLQKARIHVLVSDQSTGVKLKLLHALETSGHVLVNSQMVEGTDLGGVSIVCQTPDEFLLNIKEKQDHNLTVLEFENRLSFLKMKYDTVENCQIFEKLL